MSSSHPASLPDHVDVAIVGAGMAGLSAANSLTAAGKTVLVAEAADGVGGRVRSDQVDGFILDRGFQILLTAYPEVQRQLDLDQLDLRNFDPGAQVWLNGRGFPIADPLRAPAALLSTASSPIGTLGDKFRMLQLRQRVTAGEASQLLRNPERSTAEHLTEMGFSPRIVERFFGPLFAGIQLDPTLATSSRMFDIIFRSLSEGDAAVPARGMGQIAAQLADNLAPDVVHLETPVRAVEAGRIRTDRGPVEATDIIVATDGPAAAALLSLPVPGSRPVGCVWFDASASPVEGRSILLDGSSRGPALNVAVLSDVAPEYAPAGRSLIAAACPGDIGEDLDGRTRTQLSGWFGSAVTSTWRTIRVDRIAHGQPDQRPPFSPKQRVQIAEGLWVCGDHRDTGSIQGALYSGQRTAAAILSR